jgi:hypothetical protein
MEPCIQCDERLTGPCPASHVAGLCVTVSASE